MMKAEPFPADWHTAVVLMPHPDDPEYGSAAAVAKWTSAGKRVCYVLASSGEAGIAGMPPEQAGPLREAEQRRAAMIVGVRDVDFWDFPDGNMRNSPKLRRKIADTLAKLKPDVALTVYGGTEIAPGIPNQRDHMEFAAAVLAAYAALSRVGCFRPSRAARTSKQWTSLSMSPSNPLPHMKSIFPCLTPTLRSWRTPAEWLR
jgi:LmbE family N-acetylglucosaminyl deacetylase